MKKLINNINNLSKIFQNVYEEHLKDNNNEVLIHPLVADYTRLFVSLIKEKSNLKLTNSFLDILDRTISNDNQDVVDIIYISFIERLDKDGQNYVKNSNYEKIKKQLNEYLKYFGK